MFAFRAHQIFRPIAKEISPPTKRLRTSTRVRKDCSRLPAPNEGADPSPLRKPTSGPESSRTLVAGHSRSMVWWTNLLGCGGCRKDLWRAHTVKGVFLGQDAVESGRAQPQPGNAQAPSLVPSRARYVSGPFSNVTVSITEKYFFCASRSTSTKIRHIPGRPPFWSVFKNTRGSVFAPKALWRGSPRTWARSSL